MTQMLNVETKNIFKKNVEYTNKASINIPSKFERNYVYLF